MEDREREILSELLHRDVWERWGEYLDPRAFISKDAQKTRRLIEKYHKAGGTVTLPPKWFNGAELNEPLPVPQSQSKIESVVVETGLTSTLEQLDRLREGGEILEAEHLHGVFQFMDGIRDRTNGNARSTASYSPLTAREVVEAKEWESRGKIPTYLHKDLDEYLGGGIGRGQLCVLQAPFKKGKTTFLLTIAYRAAAAGNRTLFLSCENYLDQIGERLSQIHATHRRKDLPPKLFVHYHPRLTVRDVRKYLETNQYDFVIVDYEGKMESSVENDWTWKTTEIYNGLRDLANEHNLVMWTATQEHEGPSWQASSTRGGTWGSKTKGQLCDLLLGCFVTPQLNRVTFTVLGRRGMGREGGEVTGYFNPDTAEVRERKKGQ